MELTSRQIIDALQRETHKLLALTENRDYNFLTSRTISDTLNDLSQAVSLLTYTDTFPQSQTESD